MFLTALYSTYDLKMVETLLAFTFKLIVARSAYWAKPTATVSTRPSRKDTFPKAKNTQLMHGIASTPLYPHIPLYAIELYKR